MIIYYSGVGCVGSDPEYQLKEPNVMLSFYKSHITKTGLEKRMSRILIARKEAKYGKEEKEEKS